ncbi:MAG: MmgE/PrpD family protein [Nitrospinota bacterium]
MIGEKSLTSEVVGFTLKTGYEAIPEQALGIARRCIVDGTGLMVAGSTEESGKIIHAYLRELGGAPEATVLGAGLSAPAHLAALANGVAGHAMDYDDTQLSSYPDRVYGLLTHPTVPVLAAALAVGEDLGASGRELLAAFCVGFEVECKVAETIRPEHYTRGFHSTGTLGVFGAVTAAAKLMELDEAHLRAALGIAASESAGVRANFGTMTKPYHCGRAAENGVVAARLAAKGFTADPDILDGPWGFFQVAGGGCDPDHLRGKLGEPWSIVTPGVSIKPHPCGSCAHPAMDALRELIIENDLKVEDVERVRLGTNRRVLEAFRYPEPKTELEAKFSIPFCLGILLLERRAGIAQFKDEVVLSAPVREVMKKVEGYLDPEIDARGYELIRGRLEVRLRDGRILYREAELSRGTPQRPMSREELFEKFAECAGLVLDPGRVKAVEEAIYALDEMENVNALIEMLAGVKAR